jgi:hypothetical protein
MASWPPSLRGDPHGGPASPSGDEQWKRKSALVASVYSGLLWAQQRANTMGETREMRDTAAEWCGREDGVDTRRCMGKEGRKGRNASEAKVKKTLPMALHLGEEAIEEEGRLTSSTSSLSQLPTLTRKFVETCILGWTIEHTTTESDVSWKPAILTGSPRHRPPVICTSQHSSNSLHHGTFCLRKLRPGSACE